MNSENGENEVVSNAIRPMTTPSKLQKTPGKVAAYKSTAGTTPLRPTSAGTGPATPSARTREAAIQAKLLSTAERIKKVASLKDKWAKEKEKKVHSHRERRANEMKRQQEILLAACEQRKRALEKRKEIDDKKKAIEKERLASSLETAAQLSKDLAEKFKDRRRQSIALNNEILSRAQIKIRELTVQKKAEQDSMYESKKEDFHAVREAKYHEAKKRRESMALRTEAARKVKGVEQDLETAAKEHEKTLLDFRYTAWVGEKEYKESEVTKRRDSMAGRLDTWRKHKEIDEKQRNAEHETSLADLDLRREDWKCVQAYKADSVRKERESLQARLESWRAENAQTKLTKEEQAEADAYDFQLRSQARDDVLNYKKKLEEERRQSLAYRLDSARKDKDWERGQATLLAIATEETRKLEEENRACVDKYKQEQEEARRASIQYRNQVGVQESIRLDGVRKQELAESIQDLDLKHDDWLDVQSYKQGLRDEQRKSLAMRLVHSRKQKEAALLAHKSLLDSMHEEFELKHNDWVDVKAYEKEEKEKRRNSVCMRLDSWRAQRMDTEMEMAKKSMQAEEDAMIKDQEMEDLRAAKEALKNKEKLDILIGKMIF